MRYEPDRFGHYSDAMDEMDDDRDHARDCECMYCEAAFAEGRAKLESLLKAYADGSLSKRDESRLRGLLEEFADFPGLTDDERIVQAELRLSF